MKQSFDSGSREQGCEKVHILYTGYKKGGLASLPVGLLACGDRCVWGGRIQAYRMISQKYALRIKEMLI